MAIVEFKNVTRVYKSGDHELRALGDVNLTLEEGKFVVILGPSGAGMPVNSGGYVDDGKAEVIIVHEKPKTLPKWRTL